MGEVNESESERKSEHEVETEIYGVLRAGESPFHGFSLDLPFCSFLFFFFWGGRGDPPDIAPPPPPPPSSTLSMIHLAFHKKTVPAVSRFCVQVAAADEAFAKAEELNPRLDLTVVAQVLFCI